jgi:23S rRNA (guanosine2251-2'-O)-methyltransferase
MLRPTRKRSDGRRWLYGRHAVAAALGNPQRRWYRLAVLAGNEMAAVDLVANARAVRLGSGTAMRVLDLHGFAAILPEAAVHQGFALEVEPLPERHLDDVLRTAAPTPFPTMIIVLDRVSDPQNIGAVLRSAAAFGAVGVVVTARGTSTMTGALAKAASGALESVPVVPVVNLARALDQLKKAGFWTCGLDETARQPFTGLDLGQRIAIVLGSEGDGMRRLVRERCDFLARLPTCPAQPTLNISIAAAVALYELIRGRIT